MAGSPLLLCVVGPTAVGKTALALALAQRYGTEVLSIDSRQVYRGLAIGSNQPTAHERAVARHHLIDFLPIEAQYSVAQFETDALAVLARLFARTHVVVAVGGTGFYLRALERGLDRVPEVPAEVRAALQTDFQTQGLTPLLAELDAADPVLARTLDRQNPARVLRALAVWRATGRPLSSYQRGVAVARPFRVVKLGLDLPRPQLHQRINARTAQMLAAGWLGEVKALLAQGHDPACPGLKTIGYPELVAHLHGELPLETARLAIEAQTRQYAKRQLTWLRREPGVHWFHPADESGIFATADAHTA